MNTLQAALYLGTTKYKLKQLRENGEGPRCTPPSVGNEGFEYAQSDLDAWLEASAPKPKDAPKKPRRVLVPTTVGAAATALFPPWGYRMLQEDWQEIVSQARTARFVDGLGMVADKSLDRTQTFPSGWTGHTGWHSIAIGAVHWCFHTRNECPEWVRANVEALREEQKHG